MSSNQVQFVFMLPEEILNKLKEESKNSGVSISGLIKLAIQKSYSKEVSKMGSET